MSILSLQRCSICFWTECACFLNSSLRFRVLHADQREAIVAFVAYSLDGGGADARLGGDACVEAADTLGHLVISGSVGNFAVAYHVVGYDHGAWMREFQRPVKVLEILLLGGIQKDQVEGTRAFRD